MIHLTEIEKKVLEKYPITKKEKNCKIEKNRMNGLRAEYKKRLIEQAANSKQEYDYQPEV